jgi:beta-glucosidase
MFKPGFVWGAATASYQIEGATADDGRVDSIWDVFCRTPGKVFDGDTGDTACDHYQRHAEDVAFLRDLGVQAYRLSIAWPRVVTDASGTINLAGLDFYDRLIDQLLAAGIEPWVTLYHWDLPYYHYLEGGWLNPRSPAWFERYTRAVVDRLSDRVTRWMTLNEPQVFIGHGLQSGVHAPGDRLGLEQVLLAGHHALLAHGRAVGVLREHARRPARVGWAPVGVAHEPATDSPEDIAAARAATLGVTPGSIWNNIWWGDPVVHGRYPEAGLRAYGRAAPRHTAADLALIGQPIDFYGVNIYNAQLVRAADPAESATAAARVPTLAPAAWEPLSCGPGHAQTLFHWTVSPASLYWGPRFLHEHYRLPVVVTENGLSSMDWIALDGAVHDPQRIDFLTRYLRELRRASAEGVPIDGYFHWSLLDNFEWAEGYRHRFGLVHVDFATGARTPKDSFAWYRRVVATNGAAL